MRREVNCSTIQSILTRRACIPRITLIIPSAPVISNPTFFLVGSKPISFNMLRQVPSPRGGREANIGRDVDVKEVIRDRSAAEGP